MRKKITQAELTKLTTVGVMICDREIKGFVARRLPSGAISFGYRYRANGRQHWHSFGKLGEEITIDEARRQAKILAGAVASGGNPVIQIAEEKAANAELVVDRLAKIFLEHQAKAVRSKTLYHTERMFARFILPAFGRRQINDIKRSEIVKLLDRIEFDSTSRYVLSILTTFFNWYERRADDFRSPIVRGMARGKQEPRERVLTDDEIADIWAISEAEGVTPRYIAMLRLILLTGQRPGEVRSIEAHEVKDDVWIMPKEKNKLGIKQVVPLSQMAQAIIAPYLDRRGYILSASGKCPAPDDTRSMRALRAAIDERRQQLGREPMPNWTHHDLRRTARSLMSRDRAIQYHVAERVIGHLVGDNVARTYDHYDYLGEKLDALERLAAMVAKITGANVVPLQSVA